MTLKEAKDLLKKKQDGVALTQQEKDSIANAIRIVFNTTLTTPGGN